MIPATGMPTNALHSLFHPNPSNINAGHYLPLAAAPVHGPCQILPQMKMKTKMNQIPMPLVSQLTAQS